MRGSHGSRQRDSSRRGRFLAGAVVIGSAALLAACAGRSTGALDEARAAVDQARNDQTVVVHAPEKLQEAEEALRRTEVAFDSHSSQVEVDHLAYLAEQRAAIARATAEEQEAQTEIEKLAEEHDQLMLDSRDRQIAALERELNARETDRGLVVALGDILFDVDKAQLTPGGELQVARLADALQQMPDRNVLIEGHTDSSGSEAYNLDLSQRRAAAVEQMLLLRGVEPHRIVTRGYGEAYPVASNATGAGRQQNRRVEVVILNPGQSDAPRAAVLQ
jgi:OOP family OmpA-OmpF porin